MDKNILALLISIALILIVFAITRLGRIYKTGIRWWFGVVFTIIPIISLIVRFPYYDFPSPLAEIILSIIGLFLWLVKPKKIKSK